MMDDDPDDCAESITVTMVMDMATFELIRERLDKLVMEFDIITRLTRD